MISNHYAMTYRHEHAWAVLAAIMAAGVLIRHFFNLRHTGRIEWRYPVSRRGAAARAGGGDRAERAGRVGRRRRPGRAIRQGAEPSSPSAAPSAMPSKPTQPGFAAAPAGIELQTGDADPPERRQDLPAGGAS